MSIDKSLSFEKTQKIRKEQQKHYDMYNFLKRLNNAIEKSNKKYE